VEQQHANCSVCRAAQQQALQAAPASLVPSPDRGTRRRRAQTHALHPLTDARVVSASLPVRCLHASQDYTHHTRPAKHPALCGVGEKVNVYVAATSLPPMSAGCQQANTHLPCQQAVSRPTPTNSCPWCGVGEKVIVYMAATSLRPMSAGQHPPSKSSKSRRSARVPTADWRTATTAACRVQSSTRRCPCVPQQQFLPTAATAQPAAVHLVPKSWLECSQLRPQRAAAAATAIVDGWSAGRQAGTGQRGNTSLWAESVKRVGEWVKEPGACPQQVGCEE
jgi:hypothetical protein